MMDSTKLTYPIVNFGPLGVPPAPAVVFKSRDSLTRCTRLAVKRKTLVDSLIGDSSGNVYRITDVREIGSLGFPGAKGLSGLLQRLISFSNPLVRVEIEFDPESTISFEDVKRCLLEDLECNKHLHEQAANFQLDKLKSLLDQAQSIPQIISHLCSFGFVA